MGGVRSTAPCPEKKGEIFLCAALAPFVLDVHLPNGNDYKLLATPSALMVLLISCKHLWKQAEGGVRKQVWEGLVQCHV